MPGVVDGGIDGVVADLQRQQLVGSSSRVAGSMAAMAFGANAGRSRRRASWWKGGSEEMGGEMPCGAISLGGRLLPRMTLREVKCSVSWAMSATSWCRVGNQAPP